MSDIPSVDELIRLSCLAAEENLSTEDSDKIAGILTILANATADEPERQETYYSGSSIFDRARVQTSAEYADWQRNGRLRAELSLKAAANNNDRLRAEIEQLRAKLAEAQKNELRYFLLRQVFMDEDGVKLVENVLLEKPSDEAGFDAGIDAAIAQQK